MLFRIFIGKNGIMDNIWGLIKSCSLLEASAAAAAEWRIPYGEKPHTYLMSLVNRKSQVVGDLHASI